MNTKLFFVLTTSKDKNNPRTTPRKFVNDGFVADTFQIIIAGTLRMTNTSTRMILKQALVPPNFEINETIRSAAYHPQKLQPDCMVGVVWKRDKCTYLTFTGKSKTEMETYLLSDNNNREMTDVLVRLEDIIESKKYTTTHPNITVYGYFKMRQNTSKKGRIPKNHGHNWTDEPNSLYLVSYEYMSDILFGGRRLTI